MMEFLLDPNVAYVLLVTGFVIGVLALMSPGTGLLELAALFMLFLAGYAMFRLPIHAWALVIIILSIVPFVLSLRVYKHWALLLLSMILLVIGTVFVFPSENGISAIQPVLAVVVSFSALLVLWIVGRRTMEAIARQPSFDLDRLVGQTGEAREDFEHEGPVYVMGEQWTARTPQPVHRGDHVKITGRQGLVLLVEKVISGEEKSEISG